MPRPINNVASCYELPVGKRLSLTCCEAAIRRMTDISPEEAMTKHWISLSAIIRRSSHLRKGLLLSLLDRRMLISAFVVRLRGNIRVSVCSASNSSVSFPQGSLMCSISLLEYESLLLVVYT